MHDSGTKRRPDGHQESEIAGRSTRVVAHEDVVGSVFVDVLQGMGTGRCVVRTLAEAVACISHGGVGGDVNDGRCHGGRWGADRQTSAKVAWQVGDGDASASLVMGWVCGGVLGGVDGEGWEHWDRSLQLRSVVAGGVGGVGDGDGWWWCPRVRTSGQAAVEHYSVCGSQGPGAAARWDARWDAKEWVAAMVEEMRPGGGAKRGLAVRSQSRYFVLRGRT